jgi:FMN-dependent NADH-azoreductase
MMKRLLRIDASARSAGSVTRRLGDEFQARWLGCHPDAEVLTRDLSEPLPLLDSDWVAANLTEPSQRTPGQQAALALSDTLIAELEQADAVLVTVPLYNFSVPAAMKAWIDLVCRARKTFAYTDNGPRGLLADRPVYVVIATGGVPVGSPADFASGYLRHVFGFIGLCDVQLITAERMNLDAEGALVKARAGIDILFDTEGNNAAA